MVVNVTELKRGDILEIDGDPGRRPDVQSRPPRRGGEPAGQGQGEEPAHGPDAGQDVARRETVTTAEVDYRPRNTSTARGRLRLHGLGSYEQTTLDAGKIGDAAGYLLENLEVKTVSSRRGSSP